MRRHEDWAERLADYLESCRERPFSWASHDCATMAVGAVEAMTGERLWEPPYTDVRTAAEYLAEHSIEAIVDMHLPRVPKGFACRGDVVLLDMERPTLGVCCGAEVAAPGEHGMLMLPMTLARVAWRV